MSARHKDQSGHVRRALLIAAVVLGYGAVSGAAPDEEQTLSTGLPAAEQPAGTADANIADAIGMHMVLQGMTIDQVVAARGAPVRREVIPPDAELWHYAEGEVAFSQGKVSYVDLAAQPARTSAPRRTPQDAVAPTIPDEPVTETRRHPASARVHTPGDGFLALRSEPTARKGRRLLKIPHGSVVTLEQCVTRPADGRWCKTTYEGQVGWVYERYLVR